MNAELMNEIRAQVSATPSLTILDGSAAEVLRMKVVRRFGFPESSAWWWEHLPAPSRSIGYGDGGGLSLLSEIVPAGATKVYLFVTDDDPPPWLCLSGPPQLVMSMLAELPFFEYFITDGGMDWIVFDTHHNTLVAHGLQMTTFVQDPDRG